MTTADERPMPTEGPWAMPATVRLGIVGRQGLAQRLRSHIDVVAVGPRDEAREACKEVDALLIELSAFEQPTGPWGHALRPGGFDRGQALARLLRVARVLDRPVLAVDDRPVGDRDAWQSILATAVDDVAPLGPIRPSGVAWNPGLHWAPGVLAARTAGGPVSPHGSGGTPASGPQDWVGAQRAAVGRGWVVVDPEDPWQVHLGDELALLGVDVMTRGDGPTVTAGSPRAETLPGEAVAVLCRRLGLREPQTRPPVVVTSDPPGDFERRELDAALDGGWRRCGYDEIDGSVGGHGPAGATAVVELNPHDVVLLAAPDRPVHAPGARAATAALDRVADADVIATAGGAVVGVRGHVVRLWPGSGPRLHELARGGAVWA